MATRAPLTSGEWYHCYSRGVDKRRVFSDTSDYDRFLALMYVANCTTQIHLSNLREHTYKDVLKNETLDRGSPIVEIGTYCLMPNHVHFIVKQVQDGGIATYMQKIFTGYTMYFNKKNSRTGALFSGTFKSKHVGDDEYFKQAVSYVHLNPLELAVPKWKGVKANLNSIERALQRYKYSSLNDFTVQTESPKILGTEVYSMFDKKPTVRKMIEDSIAYQTHWQG